MFRQSIEFGINFTFDYGNSGNWKFRGNSGTQHLIILTGVSPLDIFPPSPALQGLQPEDILAMLPGAACVLWDIFHSDDDGRGYLQAAREATDRFGVSILSRCLTTNRVHFIAIPQHESSLAKGFAVDGSRSGQTKTGETA